MNISCSRVQLHYAEGTPNSLLFKITVLVCTVIDMATVHEELPEKYKFNILTCHYLRTRALGVTAVIFQEKYSSDFTSEFHPASILNLLFGIELSLVKSRVERPDSNLFSAQCMSSCTSLVYLYSFTIFHQSTDP